MLIPVRQRGVNVSVAFLEGNLDCIANFVGLALPGAKAYGWNVIACIEGKGFAALTVD